MAIVSRDSKNPFWLCLICGFIIMGYPIILVSIGLLIYPGLDITPYSYSDENYIMPFIVLGLIMIIIGIVASFQKGKSKISKKRVICPNCEIDMESLEDVGYYQCPRCKKKFRDKSQA